MDVETAIQDDYLTSPVLYSILDGIHKGTWQRVHFQVSFDHHPLPDTNNLEKKEICCKDNPYKIKMNFSYEDEYQGNEQEEVELIQLLKNRMADEQYIISLSLPTN